MKLKITWKYIVAFYLVIMLYVSLHELVHHFSAAIICGDWGYKSFNYFETACSDDQKIQYLATYIGPLFTFLMMYVGMYFLREGSTLYRKHLGFAIIFAQLPAQRIMGPFMGFNDEYYASAQLLGPSTELKMIVGVILILICLPPLVKAYKSIQNRYRIWWFLFYFLLFPYIIWGPFFGLFEYLMVDKGILNQQVIGIGLLFILNEIVTVGGHLLTKGWIFPEKSI